MAVSEGTINEIGNVIRMSLDACCPNKWGELGGFYFYTHQGLGFLVGDSCIKFGFGVLEI